jgi:hypothetical protein
LAQADTEREHLTQKDYAVSAALTHSLLRALPRSRPCALSQPNSLAHPPVRPLVPTTARRKIQGAGHDQAILSLQLDADLSSVFNWNVKQLFVYVTAEYETEANVRAPSWSPL